MPSLSNILDRATELDTEKREWLHQLVGDWQLIADFAFVDLTLLVPMMDGRFMIGAVARPATASTVLDNDVVGTHISPEPSAILFEVLETGEHREFDLHGITYSCYPVRKKGQEPIAVLAELSSDIPGRRVSLPHPSYADIEEKLLRMVTEGEFPLEDAPTGYRHGTPRVTDGFTQLDAEGAVIFSSPNATSNLHRLGVRATAEGQILAEQIVSVIDDKTTLDESLPVVLMGRAPWLSELELHGVVVTFRAVPLIEDGKRIGAVLLSRDVTELRRREMELVTKDATIREINHRVKNNLQTVSALLRMQARRATDPEVIEDLVQAQRRVETIALVHQILSQSITESVNFDEIFSPLLAMSTDIAATGVPVKACQHGSFGNVGASSSTTLAVVLNELVSNAVEHGLPEGGSIDVIVERTGDHLAVEVRDDGVGMGSEGPGPGLGTKIVRTMVEGELRGNIEWKRNDSGGTSVLIDFDVDVTD
ncbi:Two-component sensor histidine kinase, contains HisKA and HATPase domains [Actinobaculum suis]|uniref:histidine kinase n=1 Tax=Actinobaculum suis TaxID=1657 RepID=A0A0K9EQU6_9ACTO|nr:PAS domain-containing sensor histidine kinase [Actinobaculum suis]KMY22559.1 histidine kinase [Actinobaculum suis]MDY5154095.1 histidine kinase N-terminal domain-containing protein [Actinobaculum suis]OCA93843.1 histidine kinase [Actinobaculum suis]OCA95820.1 histidine kinase [Actinobaculum suis]SDE50285.1 Two-component sensor histidine kinase, contains HisKA and HATPase domains [Actinobaculum suis]